MTSHPAPGLTQFIQRQALQDIRDTAESRMKRIEDAWESADIPRKKVWIKAFYGLFPLEDEEQFPARAGRLSGYGWVPKDLMSACAGQFPRYSSMLRIVWKGVHPDDSSEALSVLAAEAANHHATAQARATGIRDYHAGLLVGRGWSQAQVSSLLADLVTRESGGS